MSTLRSRLSTVIPPVLPHNGRKNPLNVPKSNSDNAEEAVKVTTPSYLSQTADQPADDTLLGPAGMTNATIIGGWGRSFNPLTEDASFTSLNVDFPDWSIDVETPASLPDIMELNMSKNVASNRTGASLTGSRDATKSDYADAMSSWADALFEAPTAYALKAGTTHNDSKKQLNEVHQTNRTSTGESQSRKSEPVPRAQTARMTAAVKSVPQHVTEKVLHVHQRIKEAQESAAEELELERALSHKKLMAADPLLTFMTATLQNAQRRGVPPPNFDTVFALLPLRLQERYGLEVGPTSAASQAERILSSGRAKIKLRQDMDRLRTGGSVGSSISGGSAATFSTLARPASQHCPLTHAVQRSMSTGNAQSARARLSKSLAAQRLSPSYGGAHRAAVGLPKPNLGNLTSLEATSERTLKTRMSATTKFFLRISVVTTILSIAVISMQHLTPEPVDYIDQNKRIAMPKYTDPVCIDSTTKLDDCLVARNKRPDQCMPYYDTLRQCMVMYTHPDKIEKVVDSK